jgi:hypothetical protein
LSIINFNKSGIPFSVVGDYFDKINSFGKRSGIYSERKNGDII